MECGTLGSERESSKISHGMNLGESWVSEGKMMDDQKYSRRIVIQGNESSVKQIKPAQNLLQPLKRKTSNELRIETSIMKNVRRMPLKRAIPRQGKYENYENIDDTRSIMSYPSSSHVTPMFQTPILQNRYQMTSISKIAKSPRHAEHHATPLSPLAFVNNNARLRRSHSWAPHAIHHVVSPNTLVKRNPDDILSSKFFDDIDLELFRGSLKFTDPQVVAKSSAPLETKSNTSFLKPPSNFHRVLIKDDSFFDVNSFPNDLVKSMSHRKSPHVSKLSLLSPVSKRPFSPFVSPSKQCCIVADCGLPQQVRGFCCLHYPIDTAAEDRFQNAQLDVIKVDGSSVSENASALGNHGDIVKPDPSVLKAKVSSAMVPSPLIKTSSVEPRVNNNAMITKQNAKSAPNSRVPSALDAAVKRAKEQLYQATKAESLVSSKISSKKIELKQKEQSPRAKLIKESPRINLVKATNSYAVQIKIAQGSKAESASSNSLLPVESVVESEKLTRICSSGSVASKQLVDAKELPQKVRDVRPWRHAMANRTESARRVAQPSRSLTALALDAEELKIRESLERLELRLLNMTPIAIGSAPATYRAESYPSAVSHALPVPRSIPPPSIRVCILFTITSK